MNQKLKTRARRVAEELCRLSWKGLQLKYGVGNPARWAQDKRRISQGASFAAKDGPIPYSFDWVPYLREALEDVVHPEVQTTVWQWASDLGKTEGANNVIGFCIDEEPSKILVCYPIDKSAETWSKESLAKMIADTPCLREKVYEAKSRDSNNTIAHKVFPGGSVSVIAAGSVSSFRLRRARVVFMDEIDAMKGEVGSEGDPVALGLKRAEGYADSIQLLSSTPTMRNESRIEWWFNRSDKNYWFVPCLKCSQFQTLKWKQVNWKDHGNDPKQTRYHCEFCDKDHSDSERVRMVLGGQWRPTSPFTGIRGRHLNGIYSIFPAKKGYASKLHQMAQDAIDAKHSQTPRYTTKVWVNTFLAETFLEEADRVEVGEVAEHQEDFEKYEKGIGTGIIEVPDGGLILTAGVDIQTDRIEAELLATGMANETWGLEKAIFPGAPTGQRVWDALDEWLSRRYRTIYGVEMKIVCALIDQGHWTDEVRKFCRPRRLRRVYPCRGQNTLGMPLVTISKNKQGLVNVGTETAKEDIYAGMKLKDKGPGYAHFNSEKFGYNQEHFKQMTVEYAETVYSKGHRVRRFVCPPNERNEALDIRVYATAAVAVLNPQWDLIRKNLELAKQAKQDADRHEQPSQTQALPQERRQRPVNYSNYQIKTW